MGYLLLLKNISKGSPQKEVESSRYMETDQSGLLTDWVTYNPQKLFLMLQCSLLLIFKYTNGYNIYFKWFLL